MDNQALVSIIIPTCNRAQMLSRAIDSALRQTYQNIEIIIVDDCSRDNTYEIVHNYLNKDKRIVYFRNEENRGAAYSRNVGIERSQGSFLAFLDDDCEYLPEKIEEEINLMHSLALTPSIIYSNMWIEKENTTTPLSLNIKNKLLAPKDIFCCRYSFLEPTSWLCKENIIKRMNGFDINAYCYDDMDLLTRIILSGEKIYFLNKPLSIRHKVNGISDISLKQIKAKEYFLEKHFLKIKKYKKYFSRFYYRLGKDLFKLGDFKMAKEYFWKAFLLSPFKIEYFFKSIYPNFKNSRRKSLFAKLEDD